VVNIRNRRVRRAMRTLFCGALSVFCVQFIAQETRAVPPDGMEPIPAGTFEMGDHHDNIANALPVHAVYVDAFYMDIYEVTNQQYAAALNWAHAQGGLITVTNGVVYNGGSGTTHMYCDTASSSARSRITWNDSAFGVVAGKEHHPMVMVSWYGAAAYANWLSAMKGLTPTYDTSTWDCNFSANGYRLPTEAEWERAARGGLDSPYRRYPWGDTIDGRTANYTSGDPYECGDQPWTTPVGFYDGQLHNKVEFGWPCDSNSFQTSDGSNGYGLFDMAGNVLEWCNDWYDKDYYGAFPCQDACIGGSCALECTNPHGPTSGSDHVQRGGCFEDIDTSHLGCSFREPIYPTDERNRSYWGFRLVTNAFAQAACGNGILDPGEQCDDGNTVSGDGCSATCRSEVAAAMRPIPAGTFEMGDHHDGMSDAPVHSVTLDAFNMNRYEVTNLHYAAALSWALAYGLIYVGGDNIVYGIGNSLGYCDTTQSSSYSRITWNGSTFGVVAGKENHPMMKVTWYGAAAYMNWRSAIDGRIPSYDTSTWACNFANNGYRLPTEAEWEYAARGGLHNPYRRYPWGDTLDGSKANYSTSGDAYETGAYPWTTPVGYYNGSQVPPGMDMGNGYGLYDTAGNAWEWCYDRYSDSYYSSSPGSNPTGPASGGNRVLRGGSWSASDYHLRCAFRAYATPDFRYNDDYGFRLAMNAGGQGTCGNGVLDPGEQCDDGNTVSGDGCSAVCEREGACCTAQNCASPNTDAECTVAGGVWYAGEDCATFSCPEAGRIEIYDNEWAVTGGEPVRLRGRAWDSLGQPLARAPIGVDDATLQGCIPAAVITDANGEFNYDIPTFGIAEDNYLVTFFAGVGGNVTTEVEISVRPPAGHDLSLPNWLLSVGVRGGQTPSCEDLLFAQRCSPAPPTSTATGPKARTRAMMGLMKEVGSVGRDWLEGTVSNPMTWIGVAGTLTCLLPTGVTQATTCVAGIEILAGAVTRGLGVTIAHRVIDKTDLTDAQKEELHVALDVGLFFYSVSEARVGSSLRIPVSDIMDIEDAAFDIHLDELTGSKDRIVLVGSDADRTQAVCLWRADPCRYVDQPPVISALPAITITTGESRQHLVDLWAYASDQETPNWLLNLFISQSSDERCGVSLSSNRFVDVAPTPGWSGMCQITIGVDDACGHRIDTTLPLEVLDQASGMARPSQVEPTEQVVSGDDLRLGSRESDAAVLPAPTTVSFAVHIFDDRAVSWTAQVLGEASWLQITSGSSGQGNGEVVVSYEPNLSGTARDSTIRITADGEVGSPWDVSMIQEPASVGTLRTELYPVNVGAGGARWRLDQGPWLEPGITVANVLPGDHSIEYTSVAGRITPPAEVVTINELSTVVVRYYRDDCNNNSVADEDDITSGVSLDCNATRVPDECEAISLWDFNADGRVDIDDFGAFASSMNGPGQTPPVLPLCVPTALTAFDSDNDGDVDLKDFAALQLILAGG